jgi:hypothetical protein
LLRIFLNSTDLLPPATHRDLIGHKRKAFCWAFEARRTMYLTSAESRLNNRGAQLLRCPTPAT